MNKIDAEITAIESYENITIVLFEAEGTPLSMMSLGVDGSMRVGSRVVVGVKSTNVAIAREPLGSVSIANQLPVQLSSIEEGKLLSRLTLLFKGHTLESVITTRSLKRMALEVNETLIALVKSSELSIVGDVECT